MYCSIPGKAPPFAEKIQPTNAAMQTRPCLISACQNQRSLVSTSMASPVTLASSSGYHGARGAGLNVEASHLHQQSPTRAFNLGPEKTSTPAPGVHILDRHQHVSGAADGRRPSTRSDGRHPRAGEGVRRIRFDVTRSYAQHAAWHAEVARMKAVPNEGQAEDIPQDTLT